MGVAYLKISNLGTLALTYRLYINAVDTVLSTSVLGNEIKLSEYLEYSVFDISAEDGKIVPYTRETAKAAMSSGDAVVNSLTSAYTGKGVMVPATEDGYEDRYIALIVYMPEEVDNHANYLTNEEVKAPQVQLGLTLVATQTEHESDSFSIDYDSKAVQTIINKYTNLLLNAGGKVTLEEDVILVNPDTICLMGSNDATLDTNEKNIRGTIDLYSEYPVEFTITGNGTVVATDPAETAYGYTVINWSDSTTMKIMDGHYIAAVSCAYATAGTIEIYGGTFEVEMPEYTKYTLNLYDGADADIIVYGGTFKNYDPSDSASENPKRNFVAPGYTVVYGVDSNGDTCYTFVPVTVS